MELAEEFGKVLVVELAVEYGRALVEVLEEALLVKNLKKQVTLPKTHQQNTKEYKQSSVYSIPFLLLIIYFSSIIP